MLSGGPVLVTLDGSELAERALPYGTALATLLGVRVVLMTAAHLSEVTAGASWGPEAEMQQREKCLEYLDEVRQRLTYPDVDTLVRPGTPDEEILLSAEELSASVVVAATHGRSGLSRWVYGSTAGHLLHESSLPLLIIGREALERNEASPAFTHLMVPLDGSRLSEQALTPAIDVARRTSARVSLVRAVPWAAQTYPFFTPGPYVPQLDQELVARATDYLAQRRSEIPAGVNAETELLRGPAAECLLAYEEGNAVDLVVMTTHARAGLRRALLGSTADRVLHGRAPVLLIRPAETAVKPAESVATTEAAGA